ncbi:hypothetical protein, partial [Lactiplantibacillus mudanjiangensis]|uniref:hypothetical protein n=1 Tax=Lactiplantibacillus mudanjiangensis TaxID=1296538 RepID=UPI002795AFA4
QLQHNKVLLLNNNQQLKHKTQQTQLQAQTPQQQQHLHNQQTQTTQLLQAVTHNQLLVLHYHKSVHLMYGVAQHLVLVLTVLV